MTASDNLSLQQFTFHRANPNYDNPNDMRSDPYHRVRMNERGDPADPEFDAEMAWHHRTGYVDGIEVAPDQQRRGIATSMWHEGHRIAASTEGVTAPRHSPDRTDAGEAWARSLGGRLPARKQ